VAVCVADPGYSVLLLLNPLAPLLTAWSDVIDRGLTPDATDLALGAAWGLVLFVGGALFFVSREREFAVRV
jgi:teichoic acid transport system permease protein